MLIIGDKRRLYTSEKILFPSANEVYLSKCDITKYLRYKQPMTELMKKGICYHYNTLFTDLSLSAEEILAKFSRTTKQQIKRCQRDPDSGITICFYTERDLRENAAVVRELKRNVMSYCKRDNSMKLKKSCLDRNVKQYMEHRCILVSKAEFSGGTVYHLYVWSGEDSLFEYNASSLLIKDAAGILAGMANKLLVYEDMLWLKAHGVKTYDWGGIFSFSRPNGIDHFKMLFGGCPARVFSYYTGNTWRGRLLIFFKKLLR